MLLTATHLQEQQHKVLPCTGASHVQGCPEITVNQSNTSTFGQKHLCYFVVVVHAALYEEMKST